MKAESSRKAESTSSRRRGSYVVEACVICRGKKIKCTGEKPVCKACTKSGRGGECRWGKGSNVRKPRTEAHFEALQKSNESLKEYAARLESLLDDCRRKHGGVPDNGHSYLQFRPKDADIDHDLENEDWQEVVADDGSVSDTSDDPTRELCIPVRTLKLEDGGLLFHGNTGIFRFAPEMSPSPLQYTSSRFPNNPENPDACYVLLVEGVDKSHFNPSFDWSRHLPVEVPLDRPEHDKLLDLLFKFFTSWCLRIVPALFLRDMYRALKGPKSQPPPKTAHYSPMLHNAIISLATAFSDDPRIRDLKARQYFANKAKSYIDAECQHPNLSVVHALSIIASFHSTQGDQTLGYLYFGMSARISQALGLSIDCSQWVKSGFITEDDRFDRNWAYWTTFGQDVCWSFYVGRDFCVPLSTQEIPVPFVDSDFDQVPWHYQPSGLDPQPNYLSKTFAASCQLLRIARKIMGVVNGMNGASSKFLVSDDRISELDLQLNHWKSTLSPEVDISLKSRPTATPHRIMLHLVYWWLFILLHRPFYLYKKKSGPIHSSDKEIDHVKLCKRGADNILELLDTWRSLYTLRYVPMTLIQTIFSAGTVYLLMAVQATSGMRVAQKDFKRGLDQTKTCVQYLLEIGKSWQSATNIAEILNNLLHERLKPMLERRAAARTLILSQQGDHNQMLLSHPIAAEPVRRHSSSSKNQFEGSARRRAERNEADGVKRAASSSSDIYVPMLSVTSPQMPEVPQTLTGTFDRESNITHIPSYSPVPTSAQIMGPLLVEIQTNETPTPLPLTHPYETFPQNTSSYTDLTLSGYLAMIGGQTLPVTPYISPFMGEPNLALSIDAAISSNFFDTDTSSLMDLSASISPFDDPDENAGSYDPDAMDSVTGPALAAEYAAFVHLLQHYFG